MFDRLQKSFLTVETGEAYQPVRLTYQVANKPELMQIIESLQCLEKNTTPNSWTWYWKAECNDLHFESIDSFRRNPNNPLRLGTISVRENTLYISVPSFKRACMTVSFIHRQIPATTANICTADFINKVFALDERMPHGFTELFKDEELDRILTQRVTDYDKVKEQCEQAATAEEAFAILSNYAKEEAQKRLPYAERYTFEENADQNHDVTLLGFYIFLRSREQVAIRRWFGQAGFSLADAVEETVEQVFGQIDDIH